MKNIILLFILAIFMFGCEERIEDISRAQDRNGIIYMVNETKPYTGKIVGYYENGQMGFESNFKDGRENGVTKTYYENGQLAAEIKYKNGKENGITRYYNKNEQLEAEINYQDGKEI